MSRITPKTVFGAFLCILGVSMFFDLPVFRLLVAAILIYSGLVMIVGSTQKDSSVRH